MEKQKLDRLKKIAADVRLDILEEVHSASSGHPGGSLSIADILTYLYFEEMNVDPKAPKCPDRDRLVLSKGHTAPALYAVLAEKGFFDKAELKKLRHVDSFLQGHPDMKGTPGVDMTTGSLGLGFSAACGIALAAKLDGKNYRTYAILDLNKLQIDGPIAEVMNPMPHDTKFEAFGFHVIIIDGHNFEQIEAAINEAKTVKGKPTVIIAKTVKGKGVSFMENQVGWHGSAPNDEQYAQAIAEIKATM